MIAYCDGGARGNPGPSGYGAVLQDESGMVLAELSEFLGVRTNNYAEYAGLLGTLQWVIDHGYKRLRLTSDSLLMVNQIKGKFKVSSPDLKPMWEEARRRIRELDGFEISHALRHKNKEADRLANDAMDRGMGKSRSAVASAEVRATPYPTKRTAPPAPGSFGGQQESLGLSAMNQPKPAAPQMIRGFVRDGVVHLLGSAKLPDGVFVKVLPE